MDVERLKLGKKLGVVEDPRTFKLTDLLDQRTLPKVPTHWRYAHDLHRVPMFGNDQYGCCTFASHGHRIVAQEFSTRQRESPVTTADVLEGYAKVTGFRADDPSTDNGAYMLDVANYMRRTGIGMEKDGSRHTISAFVKVDHNDSQEVKTAINLFGGVWVGVALPLSAQEQTGPDKRWTAAPGGAKYDDSEPGSWGGHAIEVTAYNSEVLMAYTWGREQYMTWGFWNIYVDECYALISEDWFRSGGTTPAGFKLDQLQGWLSELR